MNNKLKQELYLLLFAFIMIVLIIIFLKQINVSEKTIEKNNIFDYNKYKQQADDVLKVLINEYNFKYKNNYEKITFLKEKESCLLKDLLNKDCNIVSYNKIYSFKTNNSNGLIGYAIFKNETEILNFLEQTHNNLLLKAKSENYSLIIYDLNIISVTGVNQNNTLMLLTDIYNKKDKEYYVFFWNNNILWFVKEKSKEKTFIRRSLGDSTDLKNTQKYIQYYNLTLP